MNPLYIVGCGAQKLDHGAPAAHLYTGTLFRATLAYARRKAADSDIRVLSAKHGLLGLSDVTAPYDLRVSQARDGWERDGLSRQLLRQVRQLDAHRTLVVLAGNDYEAWLREAWCHAHGFSPALARPLQGLAIGQQLKWLKEHTKEGAYIRTPNEKP